MQATVRTQRRPRTLTSVGRCPMWGYAFIGSQRMLHLMNILTIVTADVDEGQAQELVATGPPATATT